VTTGTRCPACGSMARPDASWCSLCHADLRSEEEKAAARPPEPWVDETVEAPEWVHAPTSDVVDGPDATSTVSTTDATDGTDATDEAALAAERRGRHARPSDGTALAITPDVTMAGAVATMPGAPAPSGPTAADVALIKAGVDVDAMMSLLAADQSKPLPALSGRLANKGNRALAAVVAVVTLTALGVLAMTLLGLFVH
jgi:hypothetical protein